MSKQSDAVAKWRRNTKKKIIHALGGKCALCGYSKCDGALEFHHIDPSIKDFHWGTINGNIRGWKTIAAEMEKCICVCSNCHREVHAGLLTIPDDVQRFDESLIPSALLYEVAVYDSCPVCGNQKARGRRTCSVECARKRKIRIVDWDVVDVIQLLSLHTTYEAVGELLGVTGAAVARKYKQVVRNNSPVAQR